MLMYEAVPLFLIPRSVRESAFLVLLSYVTQVIVVRTSLGSDIVYTGGRWLWLLYAAATLLILRRANEGSVPAWIERRISNLPGWIRGSAPGVA